MFPDPPRVLLAGVFGPYGVDDAYGRKENLMELFHNQVTKAQGIASLRLLHRSYGLYFLAANIRADTTVLDFPSRQRFIEQVKKGYDVVGISFITPNLAKAQEMARLTRLHSPDSAIILGGHGAAIEGVEKMVDCDGVARGEGIAWLRQYLGQDPDAPIVHPALPASDHRRVLGVPTRGVTGLLVPGVGCVNGCRFCSTTHFFGKAYSPFIERGKDLFRIACRVADELKCRSFFVMDENFLKNGDRAREFLAEMERNQRWFALQIFSSAEAVAAFGVENLVRLGVELIWIGVESKVGGGYDKNKGIDHKRLIRELRDHGISVLASSILCSEEDTPETVEENIRFTVGLEADMVQFMLLTGLPVTRLYEEMRAAGTLRVDLPHEEWHGQKELNYTHPLFPGDMPARLLERAFRHDYEENSSSICRMVETAIRGWRTLSALPNQDATIRHRIAATLIRLRKYRPLLPLLRRFAVNARELERTRRIEAEVKQILGPHTAKERAAAFGAQILASAWSLRVRLVCDRIQPPTMVTRFPVREQDERMRVFPPCLIEDGEVIGSPGKQKGCRD